MPDTRTIWQPNEPVLVTLWEGDQPVPGVVVDTIDGGRSALIEVEGGSVVALADELTAAQPSLPDAS